jgi:hypothetical protein
MAPISDRGKLGLMGRLAMAAFFAVFLAFGLGFLTPVFLLPVWRTIGALDWERRVCTITSARVHENSDSDGSTYRVDVLYQYLYGGRVFQGDRYRFVRMSTSGRSGKEEAVARLRSNPTVDCWVDPENPSESVLERGPSSEMWFALIPLVFVLVGAGGIYAAFARGRSDSALSLRPSRVSVQMAQVAAPSGPGSLRPRYTRRVALMGYIAFALFWNGGVSVFLYQLFAQWNRGGGFEWFLAVFLIPFVFIGLGVIAAAVHKALSLFNPDFTLSVTSSRVILGEELAIEWTSSGRIDKLTRFSIELEGREEATYRRGTDSTTDTHVFVSHALVDQLPPEIVGSGRVKVELPANSMHSFVAPNNRIVWMLRVKGEVPNWPDTSDEFPLQVGPRR